MDKISEAKSALASAESRIRELIESAAREGRYSDVAELAAMARGLQKIGGMNGSTAPDVTPLARAVSKVTATLEAADGKPKQPAKRDAKEFPRFERQGDRLVKLGWSKRDKTIYEHKAPKEVAKAVCLKLAELSDKGVFRMEDNFPMRLADESEVPSYQAYLVLAWLRDMGSVTKDGKDGYRWTVDAFGETDFEAAWSMTSRRAE